MSEITLRGREIVDIYGKIYATDDTRLAFISFIIENHPETALDFIEKGGLDRIKNYAEKLSRTEGNKIAAIKKLRAKFALGLVEAKNEVERYWYK